MPNFTNLIVATAFALGSIFLWACAATKNENAAVSKNTETAATSQLSTEPIQIKVSTNFEPKSIEVKKGQPVRLEFYRENDENCGGEVVFTQLNLRKELPVGETVLVELTPQESGEISFTCGMNMMRGKIIVH